MPALRYFVRLRIVEFQDWHTPPPSSDEDMGYGDEDTDSGDSNYNGYHPGYGGGGGGRRRPRTTRFGGRDEPRLGPGSGPACRPRGSTCAIIVGEWTCPVLSPKGAITSTEVSEMLAVQRTRVVATEADPADLLASHACSHSPIKACASDPMLAEAVMCGLPNAGLTSPNPLIRSFSRFIQSE